MINVTGQKRGYVRFAFFFHVTGQRLESLCPSPPHPLELEGNLEQLAHNSSGCACGVVGSLLPCMGWLRIRSGGQGSAGKGVGGVGWLWDPAFCVSTLVGSHRGISSTGSKEREAQRMFFGLRTMARGSWSCLQLSKCKNFLLYKEKELIM